MQLLRLLPVLLAALVVGACGSDEEGEPIPRDIASAIETQLDLIQNRVDNGSPGACADIEDSDDGGTFAEVDRQVEAIPGDVDGDVVDALRESVDRLKELVRQECEDISRTETTPEDTDTVTVEEVPTITVPTETTPPETVPEDEQDGGTEVPPGQENGGGQGQGQGPFDGEGSPGGGVPVPEGNDE